MTVENYVKDYSQALSFHRISLHNIIDASIPNKAQNSAIKDLIETSLLELQKQICHLWFDDKPVAGEQTKGVENNGGSIVTMGPITTATVPLTIVP